MKLHDQPIRGQKNKFVVTEEDAYFVTVAPDEEVPSFADILAEAFDLGNSKVVKALDEKFDNGTLILGYLEADGGLDIHVPSERTEYMNKRLEEVLDV